MNLSKLLFAATLAITSLCAQASLIEYNGYSRNSASNVVHTENQEWLMWSATLGKSVDWFLSSTEASSLRSEGWRLANFDEMNHLFTDFSNPLHTYTASSTKSDSQSMLWHVGDRSSLQNFLNLFGDAYSPLDQCFLCTQSLTPFGEISANFTEGNALAYIDDSIQYCGSTVTSCYQYGNFRIEPTEQNGGAGSYGVRGLALVKVPEPAPVALLLLGVMGLLTRKIKFDKQFLATA